MKIALIGYGKMGKAIEEIAVEKGHEVVLTISLDNMGDLTIDNLKSADVAIEFTGPEGAAANIKMCFDAGVPVVSGSTGWLDQKEEVEHYCSTHNGGFLYASNFSIGVNIFFELNKFLAQLMSAQTGYDVSMKEIHHTQKKDAPSGTAISLAEQVLQSVKQKKRWVNETTGELSDLVIESERIDPAPGTHIVQYSSEVDDIQIIHTAHSRKGFASGAVAAAEFMAGKSGIYSMKDVLGF